MLAERGTGVEVARDVLLACRSMLAERGTGVEVARDVILAC